MKAILFLQGSLGALNGRDGRPLFMEPIRGRPLLDLLLREAAASGVLDRSVFVTSADACDDPVAAFLDGAWPSVEVVRLDAGSPYAFGAASRRDRPLTSADSAGILSVEGFKTIAGRFVRDASQVVFVLDVNDAPLCSRGLFERAVPLAREHGFYGAIAPGAAALCGFQMRSFETMAGHQRALRVAESATVKERVERAMQELRRERYLDTDEQIDTVHAWQRARAESCAPVRGGLVQDTVRDYVARHGEAAARERMTREMRGAVAVVTAQAAVEMVRTALETPDSADVDAVERWLLAFEQRRLHRNGQRAFWPDYPSYLEVELTSRCNLACRFCPQTKLERSKGDLEYDTLERLLDRVADFVTLLNFSGFGEPTLHPRLFDCVRLAKAKGIPRVEIETNGTTTDEAFLDEAFASGLDILAINLDAYDEHQSPAFGSVYELVHRIIERRGDAARPFIVLQRTNMAVAGQDKKIQRDFTLWYDVADAFVIRPFNTYRGTFPDKRVVNFAPLEQGGCRKLLASALVLSSGQAVMCEQCFDGQHAAPIETAWAGSVLTGFDPLLQRLVIDQGNGRIGAFCASCSQWYQQDAKHLAPRTNRAWFARAIAESATALIEQVLDKGETAGRMHLPEIVRRSGDYGDEIHEAFQRTVGAARWDEACPSALPVPCEPIGSSGADALAEPVACAAGGGRLYVTDGSARCVAVYSSAGRFETCFGETGEPFGRLPDIAVVDKEVLVADGARVQRFTLEGKPLGVVAPDIGAPIGSIAAGRPGELFVAAVDGVLHVVEVRSGDVARAFPVSASGKVFVSSSPSSGELFVSCVDSHEVLVYDLDGELVRRVGRDEVGRLASPVHTLRWGGGYAVSNWGWQEILILSTTFEYVGALAAPGLRGSTAFDGGRLYTTVNGATPGCAVWETARVTSGV